MWKREGYVLQVKGELDDVEEIRGEDLYEVYEKAIGEDEVEVYVMGDVDRDEVKTAVDRYFKREEREVEPFERRAGNEE
ncbi:insulinase family protein, partial [Bacillus velezensis]|uniref:insulinase family protein n=1 Tax=Bacillus velezensis TaxID=492670 RepID=UPI001643B701